MEWLSECGCDGQGISHIWTGKRFIHNFGFKTQRETIIGRSKCRWNDNIQIGHKENETGGCELDSCDPKQGLLIDCCEHGNEISDLIKDRELLE